MSNPKEFRYEIIYNKTKAGGFLNARRMPLRAHENILIFYRSLPTYNPQFVVGYPYVVKHVTNGDGRNYGKFERSGEVRRNEGYRFPTDVITFSNGNNKMLHPTQKLVDLLRYLIRTYTNPRERVLDCCAGVMSTGVACLREGRMFIGIELDKEYFRIGSERIDNERNT